MFRPGGIEATLGAVDSADSPCLNPLGEAFEVMPPKILYVEQPAD